MSITDIIATYEAKLTQGALTAEQVEQQLDEALGEDVGQILVYYYANTPPMHRILIRLKHRGEVNELLGYLKVAENGSHEHHVLLKMQAMYFLTLLKDYDPLIDLMKEVLGESHFQTFQGLIFKHFSGLVARMLKPGAHNPEVQCRTTQEDFNQQMRRHYQCEYENSRYRDDLISLFDIQSKLSLAQYA